MSEPADDGDILGWELDQLAKLKLLKEAYGWDEEDPKYKAKLKQVQQLGKQRAAEALGKVGGKEAKAPKKTYTWESILDFKAKDWDEAKTKLQKITSKGEWQPDRRCPQTQSGGMVTRRFKCPVKDDAMVYLARIVDKQDGNWLLQRGIMEDMDEDEPSDDEKDDKDKNDDDSEEEGGGGPSGRRGAAAPSAKKAKGAAAAAPAPAPAPSAGKRGRKAKQ